MAGFDLLCCVVNFGEAASVMKIAGKYGVKEGIISIARGSAHSRFLKFLMINEIRKEIVTMIVSSDLSEAAIKGISADMAFDKPHHGIAFLMPLSEFADSTQQTDNNTDVRRENNNMYSAIYVVVDKGTAEDIIDVANAAGARGGTIINARGSGIHTTQKLFSIEVEPEKEKIFIIAKNETKDSIITAIRNYLNVDEDGNGIIFVLDVKEAYGLALGGIDTTI